MEDNTRIPRHRREVACVDAYPAVKERRYSGAHARPLNFHNVVKHLDTETRHLLAQEAKSSIGRLRAFHEGTAAAMVQHAADMLAVRP